MCYNVVSATRSHLKYARHRGADPGVIAKIVRYLDDLQQSKQIKPLFRVNGFTHPNLIVFTGEAPFEPHAFRWGLIPHWAADNEKAEKLSNMTLNARAETMFEKPAFRSPARNRRCLIYLDAFYEHHHAGKINYPFHISMKDRSPVVTGGLWEEWADRQTGEIIRTVSIVTCRAEGIMAWIHNNPKGESARMPVILSREKQEAWLAGDEATVRSLCNSFPDELLEYYSVRPILGKNAVENSQLAEEPYAYQELSF